MSEPGERRRIDLDWVRVIAGALAAVSSAVLLSTLGAAGTLAGAALGSVIVSISTSLYGTGLARGTEKVAVAQTVALRKVGAATEEIAQVRRDGDGGGDSGGDPDADPDAPTQPIRDPDESLEHAEQQLTEAVEELEQATAADPGDDQLSWAQRLTVLPWKRIAIAAAGLFVVAMVLLTAFEVVGGRSIASYTGGSDDRDGGTSLTGFLGDRSDSGGDQDQPTEDGTGSPSPGGPASDVPTDPSEDEPTGGEPTQTPSPTDDETTEEPTDDPGTEDPSESPTRATPSAPTTSAPTTGTTTRGG